jgi:hypothetical protein
MAKTDAQNSIVDIGGSSPALVQRPRKTAGFSLGEEMRRRLDRSSASSSDAETGQ